MPLDPFGGSPLRLVRLDDGLVIYSLSPDGRDNSDDWARSGFSVKNKGLNFWLWDA